MEMDADTEEQLRAEVASMRNQRNEARGAVQRLTEELEISRAETAAVQALLDQNEANWQKVYVRAREELDALTAGGT